MSKTDKPASIQLTFFGLSFPGFSLIGLLPYVEDVLDKIKRILLETGVKVAFKLFLTVGKFLPFLKYRINHTEKSNLVYEVPYQNCDFVYLGQTKQVLKSRITEYQQAIKF